MTLQFWLSIDPISNIPKCYTCRLQVEQIYMWQSWVETKHYSVVHFDRSSAFEAL